MKRRIWQRGWLMFLLLALVLAGCSSPAQTGPGETPGPDAESPPGADPFPPSAYEGKLEGLPYGLGDLTEGMIEELGEPESMDYFTGGLYFAYPEAVYFTDASLREDDSVAPGSVKRIGLRPGTSLFGVTVGDAFTAIAGVLGEPSAIHSPADNADDGYYEELWSAHYRIGDYELVFVADTEDGASTAAYYEAAA